MGKQVYVELPVRASMDRLWKLTQDPACHPRWDLRFTAIIPAPGTSPQEFRYEFRLSLHTIHGTGTSLGTRTGPHGQATSVLKFTTRDALSPIGPGAGYWRYFPGPDGVRFITGYDYAPGWGPLGRWLDAPLIRPALGWATAWSFDRLRLWAEDGIPPERARRAWLLDTGLRAAAVAGALCLLIRHPRPGTALAAAAAVAGAGMLPADSSVPRAARCRRQAPDRRSSRPPASLAALPEPA
ncbi:MAG: SRPBCC family protein [Arthrobacter sp.]